MMSCHPLISLDDKTESIRRFGNPFADVTLRLNGVKCSIQFDNRKMGAIIIISFSFTVECNKDESQ